MQDVTQDAVVTDELAEFVQRTGFKPRGENNEVMTVLDDESWKTVQELERMGISKSMTVRAGVVAMMKAAKAGKLQRLAQIAR